MDMTPGLADLLAQWESEPIGDSPAREAATHLPFGVTLPDPQDPTFALGVQAGLLYAAHQAREAASTSSKDLHGFLVLMAGASCMEHAKDYAAALRLLRGVAHVEPLTATPHRTTP